VVSVRFVGAWDWWAGKGPKRVCEPEVELDGKVCPEISMPHTMTVRGGLLVSVPVLPCLLQSHCRSHRFREPARGRSATSSAASSHRYWERWVEFCHCRPWWWWCWHGMFADVDAFAEGAMAGGMLRFGSLGRSGTRRRRGIPLGSRKHAQW
jgi:hypothetical protein